MGTTQNDLTPEMEELFNKGNAYLDAGLAEVWNSHREVAKGNYAEELVASYLRAKNIAFTRFESSIPHSADFFCYKDGKHFIVEVKAKPACVKYPETGIDKRHYETYLELSREHNMPVWLVFVDHKKKEIYGNKLDVLSQHFFDEELANQYNDKKKGTYPKWSCSKNRKAKLVYFSLKSMIHIKDLSDSQCAELSRYSIEHYNQN